MHRIASPQSATGADVPQAPVVALLELACPRHQWTPPRYHHADPQFWTSPCKVAMGLRNPVFLVVHVTRSMAQRGHKMARFVSNEVTWTNGDGQRRIETAGNCMMCDLLYACLLLRLLYMHVYAYSMHVCIEMYMHYKQCMHCKQYSTPSLKIAAEHKQRLLWWYALNDGREACNIREEHSHLSIRGITCCTFHTAITTSSTLLAIASYLLRSFLWKHLRVCPSAFLSETSILASASFRIINWTTGLGGTAAIKILKCGGEVGSVRIWLPKNLRKEAVSRQCVFLYFSYLLLGQSSYGICVTPCIFFVFICGVSEHILGVQANWSR